MLNDKLKRLGRTLLDPLAPHLDKSLTTLVVSPDGLLWLIPWCALIRNNERYLIEKFLDKPLFLSNVTTELGLKNTDELRVAFRLPQFSALGLAPLTARGKIRRDSWEDYFGQVVRTLGLGEAVSPLDSITRPDIGVGALDVTMSTNKRVYSAGDRYEVKVTNRSRRDVFIELILTSGAFGRLRGRQFILTRPGERIAPGQSYSKAGDIDPSLGKDLFTVYASPWRFPPGQLLTASTALPEGEFVFDRVVHDFYSGRSTADEDPARVMKLTVAIETR